MSQLRYYMYLRKSNESDEKQELSLPAQESALMELVNRRGLTLVGEPFKEARSAKHEGRPLFNEMIAGLREKRADGIICWHLDRLSRNPNDEGIVKCGVLDGTIQEIVTPERVFRNTPDDGLLSSAMATKYSQDLSKNVKRGNVAALERGLWPSKPKLGYVRDPETKKLMPDAERFERVREIWRLRLNGTPMGEILRIVRDEWALTTPRLRRRGGKLLSRSSLWRLLEDPFYAGLMVRKEGTYEGSHQPMITMAEFERIQAMKQKYGPRSGPRYRSRNLPYRGLISCGRCGALVTGQLTTNRHGKTYRYWHCGRKSRNYGHCPERSIEQTDLERQVIEFLQSLHLSEDMSELLLAEANKVAASVEEAVREEEKARSQELERIDRRLRKLRELCVDGVISSDELVEDKAALMASRLRLVQADDQPSQGTLIKPLRESISFARLAVSRFESSDDNEKRRIVQSVSSNLTLEGKNLLVQAKEPFASYARIRRNPVECADRNTIKTLLEHHQVP